MEQLNPEAIIHVGSLIANVLIAWVMMRVKLEVSEMKVWIFQNFERRKES